MRELLAGFKFYEAIAPKEGTAWTGATIDLQGYETCTFVLHLQSASGVANTISLVSRIYFKIQHANGSVSTGICSGPDSTWSAVSDTDILIERMSMGSFVWISKSMSGDDGIWMSIHMSATSIGSMNSQIYKVAYIGKKRFVRIIGSNSAAADCSAIIAAAIAIVGDSANWPVNAISTNA